MAWRDYIEFEADRMICLRIAPDDFRLDADYLAPLFGHVRQRAERDRLPWTAGLLWKKTIHVIGGCVPHT